MINFCIVYTEHEYESIENSTNESLIKKIWIFLEHIWYLHGKPIVRSSAHAKPLSTVLVGFLVLGLVFVII